MIKKQIPNLITLSNLLCGCLSIYFAVNGFLIGAGLCIFLGGFFDFFDGMVARLLRVQSELGLQLDSLADVVTFGVAPAFIAQQMLLGSEWGTTALHFIPFMIPLFSAYRLAKFNIDERQTSSFIGLPTPANALVWASFPFFSAVSEGRLFWRIFPETIYVNLNNIITHPVFICITVVVLSILLVVDIPLMSLKFKKLHDKQNLPRWILLGSAVLLFVLFSALAFPFIILLYILLSFIFKPEKS